MQFEPDVESENGELGEKREKETYTPYPNFLFGFDLLSVAELAKTVELNIKEAEPCFYNGIAVPASTSGEKGSPVCFSVPELQKISPTSLKTQLVALFLHELSHQYGADELTAQKIQKMVAVRLNFLTLLEANAKLLFSTKVLSTLKEDAPFHVIGMYSAELIGASGALKLTVTWIMSQTTRLLQIVK